jgi:hypothetical protein
MKLKILAIVAIATFFASFIAFARDPDNRIPPPKHAQNLGELSKLFKRDRGLSSYREEMSGALKPDKLGTNLPRGLTVQDIVQLVAPHEDLARAIIVGAKAFPYRSNTYVAVACFTRSENEYQQAIKFQDRSCQKKAYNRNDAVYLGLIEYNPSESKPRLIAKSNDIEAGWNFTTPEQFRASSDKRRRFLPYQERKPNWYSLVFKLLRSVDRKNLLLPYGDYREFDIAPFKISDTQTAFGLRISQFDGYAGGFGYFEVLALFTVENNRIVSIFAEPMYFYQNLAGEWNKDHTRQHYLYEAENVLVVLPSKSGGYYDLQIKSLENDWQRVFTWNKSLKYYQPVDVSKL